MVEDVVHALCGPPAYLESRRIAADETDAIAHGAQVLATAGREVIENGDVRPVAVTDWPIVSTEGWNVNDTSPFESVAAVVIEPR